VQPTKTPTRDYKSYSDTDWAVWDTLYARRSNRKYLAMDPPDELLVPLAETTGLAGRVRGARPGTILTVSDRRTVERVRKGSYKGIPNKINLWLARSPVSGFLALALDAADVAADRPVMLPGTVMAAEDCVLWLTERGVGTCWLAGVNSEEVVGILGLGAGVTVPVLIPFGRTNAGTRSLTFDALMYGTLSRRRKQLSAIASAEEAGTPYEVGDIKASPFSAPAAQDVRGLLGAIEAGASTRPTDPPLDLAVDAVLESARIAPNGGNMQKWKFVAVLDPGRLERLARAAGAAGRQWRFAIVGAGAARRMETGWLDKPMWMIDVPIAFSHISLVAASMGLQPEVLTGGFDEMEVGGVVGMPGGSMTVGVVGIS